MKISDIIIEANPAGTSRISSLQGKLAKKSADIASGLQAEKQKWFGDNADKLAKQNQKKWYTVVKKRQAKNINMNDDKTYRTELYKFLTSNGKLKLNLKFVNFLKTVPLTDAGIIEVMKKAIDERKSAQAKLANAQPSTVGGTA